ncbi:PA domain-containing protein, partial [Lysinibacillus sp. OL1]|uniref:PA domain-containing protein n=1 Tax=Lysinibacillus sp. OL1 TaxID=2517243 RepID=UPI0010D2A525
PERGWDDFKGLDLKGKVAVFLVNDPDFEAVAGDDAKGKFGDRRMTYYGRWTYKYEEAARRGAVGALIVHDTPGAGYGWNTVMAPAGENYD